MKLTILVVALCALSISAFAQSALDPATNLNQDFEAFSIQHRHVFEDIQALSLLAQQQKKQIDDLTKQISDAKKPPVDTSGGATSPK